jgi:hypothetical protein
MSDGYAANRVLEALPKRHESIQTRHEEEETQEYIELLAEVITAMTHLRQQAIDRLDKTRKSRKTVAEIIDYLSQQKQNSTVVLTENCAGAEDSVVLSYLFDSE